MLFFFLFFAPFTNLERLTSFQPATICLRRWGAPFSHLYRLGRYKVSPQEVDAKNSLSCLCRIFSSMAATVVVVVVVILFCSLSMYPMVYKNFTCIDGFSSFFVSQFPVLIHSPTKGGRLIEKTNFCKLTVGVHYTTILILLWGELSTDQCIYYAERKCVGPAHWPARKGGF